MDSAAASTTDPSGPTNLTVENLLGQTCTTPLLRNDQRQPNVDISGGQESSQGPESKEQPDISFLAASSTSSDIIPSAMPKAEREKREAIRPKPQKRWMDKPGGWFWELVTWLFGTVSILAIILVLALFNHKNVEQWRSSIKINTIVSVLSQAAVSALMVSVSACVGQMKWVWCQSKRSLVDIDRFDFASRGPQGSVMFLCNKRRMVHFTALGALATILMLGFHPFAQQTVGVNGVRWRRLPVEPSIGRATQFSSFDWTVYNDRGQTFDNLFPLPSIQNAAVAGLVQNDSDPSQVSGVCPTSNCTWEPYDSLALCSTVEDITSAILLDCHNDTLSPFQSCNISTTASKAAGFPDSKIVLPPPDTTWITISNTDGYVISNGSTTWLDVYIFYAVNFNNGSTVQIGNTLFALKTRLSPCLQKLQTNMENGATKTSILDSQDDSILPKDLEGPNGSYSGFESFFSWANGNLFNVSLLVFPDDNLGLPNPLAQALLGPSTNTIDRKAAEQGVRDLMGNFTTAISNAMRLDTHVGDNITAIGVAWVSETFIQVEFLWLIGPIITWLLATLFLFITILMTKKQNIPLWKSSVLALVLSQSKKGASNSVEDIEGTAEKVTIQLTHSGDTWWLTYVE